MHNVVTSIIIFASQYTCMITIRTLTPIVPGNSRLVVSMLGGLLEEIF